MGRDQPATATTHRRRRLAVSKPGTRPGTLIHNPSALPTTVRVLRYSPEEADDYEEAGMLQPPHDGEVVWLDVVGLADVERIRDLGEVLRLHPLLLEDVVNGNQRPKVEAYGEDRFVIARMVAEGESEGYSTEQVGMLVRRGLVITFQERPGDVFDRVRERLRTPGTRIRARGSDYLAYAILDALIDGYMPVVDRFGEQLGEIEASILAFPEKNDLLTLHHIRRELIDLRRLLVPTREAISGLAREAATGALFAEETAVFLRDCYDHAVRTLEQVDGDRELAASVMELYLSNLANKTNDVMKVLTMIATIFIPLSFLVGLYGMNFDTGSPWNMPELGWRFGYPVLLGIMATVVLGFVWYFRRRRWF